jgi:hypothetical protein
MKFDVTFNSNKIVGPGSLYLDETGIVAEGDVPRFFLPLLSGRSWFRQIICSRGMRTIPYSRIVKYKSPGLFGRQHTIVYRLPGRSKTSVVFTMASKTKQDSAEFAARFHEYNTAMKQFLKGGI